MHANVIGTAIACAYLACQWGTASRGATGVLQARLVQEIKFQIILCFRQFGKGMAVRRAASQISRSLASSAPVFESEGLLSHRSLAALSSWQPLRHASASSWANVSQRENSVGDPSFLQRRPPPTNYGIRQDLSAMSVHSHAFLGSCRSGADANSCAGSYQNKQLLWSSGGCSPGFSPCTVQVRDCLHFDGIRPCSRPRLLW